MTLRATTTTSPRRVRQRIALLFAAFVTMAVMCSAPARGAMSCPFGEGVELVDPVVVVVDGAGDAAQEQLRWSSLAPGYMEGMQDLYFDEQKFELERVE